MPLSPAISGPSTRVAALLDPRQLERLYRQHGVQDMRLYPIRDEDTSWLSSSGQNSLWQTARQLWIPLTWFGYCRQIPLLEPILQRFPQVKVIIDHLGEPRLSEGLDGDFRLLLQAARHPISMLRPPG